MAIYVRLKSRQGSMLFAADPLASQLVLPELDAASSTIDGSGRNSSNVAGELAPAGSWQKTLLESLALSLVSHGSCGKWKRWVTKRCPSSLGLMTWAPRTVDREYSLWPTPTVADAARRAPESANGKLLRGAHTGWCVLDVTGFSPHPEFIEWLMGFPIGWTEHPLSVMQLSLELPKSSDAE